MALIDKYTEVETLYANNEPIEYVVKSPSVDIWRHEVPVITPKRQIRYYPCWLERLDWPMGYVYDPLNFERQEA